MSHPVVAFLIVLGILVFIHELGHFLAARLCGVGIQVFSLGFGPKLFKKRLGMTEYCICAVPLGGYVKMVGDEPDAVLTPEEKELSFNHKSLFKKSLIVAAGPAFNFFLAILIFYLLFQFSGIYFSKPEIGEVIDRSPASEAGLEPGDVIIEMDSKPVESFEQVSDLIRDSRGRDLNVVLDRNGQQIHTVISPRLGTGKDVFGLDEQRYLIGISTTGKTIHKYLNPMQAMGHSLEKNYEIVQLTIVSIKKMIEGTVSSDNLGGPILIAQMAGTQAKAGLKNFAFFVALLSINLGIINLFPIPVLDGGHLMFFGIEAVTRKPVNERVREVLTQMGMALIIILMVFVFYNDILRLFNNGG